MVGGHLAGQVDTALAPALDRLQAVGRAQVKDVAARAGLLEQPPGVVDGGDFGARAGRASRWPIASRRPPEQRRRPASGSLAIFGMETDAHAGCASDLERPQQAVVVGRSSGRRWSAPGTPSARRPGPTRPAPARRRRRRRTRRRPARRGRSRNTTWSPPGAALARASSSRRASAAACWACRGRSSTPPSDGRSRPGQPVLLVLEARLAEVDVAVDHAGQDVQAGRIENFGRVARRQRPGSAIAANRPSRMPMSSRRVGPAPTTVPLRTTRSKGSCMAGAQPMPPCRADDESARAHRCWASTARTR